MEIRKGKAVRREDTCDMFYELARCSRLLTAFPCPPLPAQSHLKVTMLTSLPLADTLSCFSSSNSENSVPER